VIAKGGSATRDRALSRPATFLPSSHGQPAIQLAFLDSHRAQKISVLQHDPAAHLPQRPGDPTPTSRNLDPLQHPFARARERTRAVNAAKMERMFAKPFVGSIEGHVDAIEVLVRKPGSLSIVASGSWDGGMYVSPREYTSTER
jgi:hypothetical protein